MNTSKFIIQLERSVRVQPSIQEQFRRIIVNLIQAAMVETGVNSTIITQTGLRKTVPYWYPYTTMAKMRWLGRELLEVVSTEFRDRSMEYYRYALESGVTTVNGEIAKPDTVLKNGDRIENVVHRHEPPVTSRPVKVLYQDFERQFIVVDKPGSIPVHASGRYYKNTLIEILVNEFGFAKVYPINRLDRLTSGLMIIPLSPERARELQAEFIAGTVQKEYVARCRGRFPEKEVVCEEPLLTVDRQMGLNIVHPQGKPARTVFNLIRYDKNTDSSIVQCRPLTGRCTYKDLPKKIAMIDLDPVLAHQLRVHLQFLGHPIANDPIYSEERIWGKKVGKDGIDSTPSEERFAPAPPNHLQNEVQNTGNPELLSKFQVTEPAHTDSTGKVPKLLPRETGEDIGMGSPVPLSKEAVEVITRLRNMKDEDEDWSRWRDVIFRAKGALTPSNLTVKPPPPPNKRRRGGKGELIVRDNGSNAASDITTPAKSTNLISAPDASLGFVNPTSAPTDQPSQFTVEEVLKKLSQMESIPDPSAFSGPEHLYCPECYLPLHPDPKPEKLYIFLHALKYTTSLGAFETDMPEWATKGYEWGQSCA